MKVDLQHLQRAPLFWIVVAAAVLLLTNLAAAVIDAVALALEVGGR